MTKYRVKGPRFLVFMGTFVGSILSALYFTAFRPMLDPEPYSAYNLRYLRFVLKCSNFTRFFMKNIFFQEQIRRDVAMYLPSKLIDSKETNQSTEKKDRLKATLRRKKFEEAVEEN